MARKYKRAKSLDEAIRRFNDREKDIPELDLLEKVLIWDIPYRDYLLLRFSEDNSSDK